MKKTKILAVLLAGIMVIAMLAGCGGGSSTVNGLELNDEVLKLEGYLASAEPLDLTVHYHQNNGVNLWKTDGPVAKEVARLTNINLINTASAGQADSKQAYSTMLMDDVLPDIIQYGTGDLDQAGVEGALIPLEDLIEKYAPNMYKYFQEHPDYLAQSKAYDGHLYYIPTIVPEGPTEGWIIRKDWLDKLGLQAPTNVDEFYNVLKAFREQDPNGNGLKDEIPFLDRTNTPADLLGLFGVDKANYKLTEDGTVISNKTTEEYKYAMKELARWYAEGLIDPEIFTRKNAREELFANNKGGVTVDWFSSTFSFNETLSKKALGNTYFGFELMTIDPPKDINGLSISYTPRSVITGSGWGISKDNKYVAETMKLFDFWFTEEGTNLMSFGPDRKTNADGTCDYSDEARAYVGGPSEYTISIGAGLNIGYASPFQASLISIPEIARDDYLHYKNNVKHIERFPTLKNTPDEARVSKTIGTDVNTYISEMFQNWLLGNKDVEATWDEYIARVNELGMPELLAATQSAYDRMYK